MNASLHTVPKPTASTAAGQTYRAYALLAISACWRRKDGWAIRRLAFRGRWRGDAGGLPRRWQGRPTTKKLYVGGSEGVDVTGSRIALKLAIRSANAPRLYSNPAHQRK